MSVNIKNYTGFDFELLNTTNQYFNLLVKTPKKRSKPVIFGSLSELSNINIKLVRESDNVTIFEQNLTDSGQPIETNEPKRGYIRFKIDASIIDIQGLTGDACQLYVSLTGIFGTINLKNDGQPYWGVFIRKAGT
jgi:hypothetical protein